MPSAEARIFVRNDAPIRLDEGVVAGGGVVVPLEEANAIVWAASDPEELARALHPGIRWVQLSFAGIEEFFAAGVVDDERLWTAAQGVYAGPIAEYVLAMMLAVARLLPRCVGQRSWHAPGVRRVAGTTLGIVGAGGVGGAVIELVAPF